MLAIGSRAWSARLVHVAASRAALVSAHRWLSNPVGSHWSDGNGWRFGAATIAGSGMLLSASVIASAESPSEPAKTAKPSIDFAEVRKDIAAILEKDPSYDDGSYGPILVRLAWHASGSYDKSGKAGTGCPVGGSNGSTMRFKPESDFGANAGLAVARQVLEPIKKKYGDALSYADLWTLAAVVAIEEMGGPTIPWKSGRTDAASGDVCPPDGRLPDATQGAQHIRDIFYRMGFNDREIVALIGAHAMGRCHPNRSGFSGPWTNAPTTFSNEFFRLLIEEKWTKKNWSGPLQYEDKTGKLMMLPADMSLISDPGFKKYVEMYAKDEQLFFKDFSSAFKKLTEAGVKFPSSSWWSWFLSWFMFGAFS